MKRTRVKPFNLKRRRLAFIRNFHSLRRVEWIRSLACAFCGSRYQVRNAHMVARKMGGCGGDYTKILPACRDCDERWSLGRMTFLSAIGLAWDDVEAKLAAVNAAWDGQA